MKQFIKSIFLLLMLAITAFVCNSCEDNLDIEKDYTFSVETLPLPSSLENGESVDLEFSILRDGYYDGASYKFRYFQSSGEGSLTDSTGTAIPMNRFQKITSDDFTLHYTNQSDDQQELDFVFEDNFGQTVSYSVTFSSE